MSGVPAHEGTDLHTPTHVNTNYSTNKTHANAMPNTHGMYQGGGMSKRIVRLLSCRVCHKVDLRDSVIKT